MLIIPILCGGFIIGNLIFKLYKENNHINIIKIKTTNTDIIDKNTKIYKCTKENLICPIKLEKIKINDYIRELKCNHKFLKDEIDKWLNNNNSCPLCRKNVY